MSNCPRCDGSGFTLRREPDGREVAVRCGCVLEGPSVSERLAAAELPEKFHGYHFALVNTTDRNAANAFLACSDWAMHFPKTERPGLLLTGPTGTGKTLLAVSALRLAIENGHKGLFLDYGTFLEALRQGYRSNQETGLYAKAMDAEILLLDDLGAHRMTEWVEDTVTSLITHRYNHNLALIVTTNLSERMNGGQETLVDRIGQRSFSRLMEMCRVIPMEGKDYRLSRKLM